MDNSIIKRDFVKIYHQKGQQTDNENQGINFFSEETSIIYKWVIEIEKLI